MSQETTFRTRYAETDQMGVIYHANYFTWFEIGRTDFFRKMGMTYRSLEDENILLPVIDVGCKYIIAAKYDDEITVKTKLTKLKGVKLQFEYEVYRKADDVLLAKGYTMHAFVNKELKPVNFRKSYKAVWDMLSENIE
ncbi:acyl-CoA thioesterase [Sporosalibacterium faouarense]|uniref:acyl-CoA thioesterase n=1 Tax=Sporosalibacterium faouarense TaxID=516123 RepID=UPI00141C1702|nr:thioesterase family protein [Sporosalibacterium faouarense]MTI47304.1 acyl-CoA thioesterase [Bacillota bacterium]